MRPIDYIMSGSYVLANDGWYLCVLSRDNYFLTNGSGWIDMGDYNEDLEHSTRKFDITEVRVPNPDSRGVATQYNRVTQHNCKYLNMWTKTVWKRTPAITLTVDGKEIKLSDETIKEIKKHL